MKKFFKFIKTNRKARIFSVTIVSIATLFLIVNYGRYVKDIIDNYITRTQRFYFNSDKLTTDCKEFEINYWPGVDPYPINIQLNSMDNNLRVAPIDIDYTVTCSPTMGLRCDLSQTRGTIDDSGVDSFVVTAIPDAIFDSGDTVSLTVKAKASEPFEKELCADFVFVVGDYGLSYKIEDEANSPYLEAIISNTVDYYKVIEPFGENNEYYVGRQISASLYEELTPAEQAKCASALITLSFDPTVVRLDMTNYYYQNKRSQVIDQIGGFDYVKEFTFAVKPQTSVAIKFYKLQRSNDYTYPLGNNPQIVQFSAE